MTKMAFALVGVAMTVVACSDGASPETTATTASPLVVARLEGTFAFDLDASDVADGFHARCTKDAGGDAAKADACYAAIRNEARAEKVRFAKNAEGQLVFTSFGPDEAGTGKEEVYLEAPVTLSRGAGENALVAKAAGFPRGSFVSRVTFALRDMNVEVPGGGTLIVTDAKKGRLVYRKE